MTGVNIVGSQLVANAQTLIVYVVLGILSVFAIVTLVNMTPSLLAPPKCARARPHDLRQPDAEGNSRGFPAAGNTKSDS